MLFPQRLLRWQSRDWFELAGWIWSFWRLAIRDLFDIFCYAGETLLDPPLVTRPRNQTEEYTTKRKYCEDPQNLSAANLLMCQARIDDP